MAPSSASLRRDRQCTIYPPPLLAELWRGKQSTKYFEVWELQLPMSVGYKHGSE